MSVIYTDDWYQDLKAMINGSAEFAAKAPQEKLVMALEVDGDDRSPYVAAGAAIHYLIVLDCGKVEEIVALEEQKARMVARMQVIEKLQKSRPEVVKLFDDVVRTLPEGVYLTSVKQSDRRLEFNGVAQSSTRVSAFMRNIDASEVLAKPDLKVIETGTPGAGSKFTLFAQLKSPEPETPAGPAEKKRVKEASR